MKCFYNTKNYPHKHTSIWTSFYLRQVTDAHSMLVFSENERVGEN